MGAVKGVILSSNPETRIVDLTHEIPPQDIEAAAFNLLAAYKSFPAGTIHVAVVDPGVGSTRRGICVVAGNHYFVGPDNGIFSYIYEREPGFRVFELADKSFFAAEVSSTFHGRDVFAPVAAALAAGVHAEELGAEINDVARLEPLGALTFAKRTAKGEAIQGRLIHIDRFGNCVTNITRDQLTPDLIRDGGGLWINGRTISSFRDFFVARGSGKHKAGAKKVRGRRNCFASGAARAF